MEPARVWTIRSLLQWSGGWLARLGIDAPRLDGELLLAETLQVRRIDLFLDPDRPLTPTELAAFKTLIKRRAEREPAAYILGRRPFWKSDFTVGEGVLIPRPETERLVEAVLERYPQREAPLRMLDIGVGSGAILLTLLGEYPEATGVGVDLSPQALGYARANADRLGVAARATLQEGDLCASLPEEPSFDLIVSNPPYIAREVLQGLEPEVSRWEPRMALDGGADGLEIYRRLMPQVQARLRPGGTLLVEIGADQSEAVAGLLHGTPWEGVEVLLDHGRRPRVVVGKRCGAS